MTSCVNKKYEVRFEDLSQSVSQNNSGNIQSSGVGGKSSGGGVLVTSQPVRKITMMRRMEDDLRILVFHGNGTQDPKQHLFVCEAIWTAKQIQYQDAKIMQLATTFRDKYILWYMKFQSTMLARKARMSVEIKVSLITDFKKSKFEFQCITELKEIKQNINESVWDFNHRFNTLMDQLIFQIPPQQYKECFITTLLPHIRVPLMQHKLATHNEALKFAIMLEASPIGESSTGMAQVQSQLVVLTLQLQDITKMKDKRHDLWCTLCKVEGHYRNQ